MGLSGCKATARYQGRLGQFGCAGRAATGLPGASKHPVGCTRCPHTLPAVPLACPLLAPCGCGRALTARRCIDSLIRASITAATEIKGLMGVPQDTDLKALQDTRTHFCVLTCRPLSVGCGRTPTSRRCMMRRTPPSAPPTGSSAPAARECCCCRLFLFRFFCVLSLLQTRSLRSPPAGLSASYSAGRPCRGGWKQQSRSP